MVQDRERLVAYVAGRMATHSTARLIRDEATGQSSLISGDVTDDRVHVYDFESGSYVSGTASAGRLTLFHARDNSTTELTADGTGRFTGYDYAAGHWFAVTVVGRTVSITGMTPGQARHYTV